MGLFLLRPERNSSDYVKLNNTSLFCYYRTHKTEIRTSHLSGLLSNWAMPCQWFCQEMNCILLWIIILILITWLIKKSHCALASQSGSKLLLKKKSHFQAGTEREESRWMGALILVLALYPHLHMIPQGNPLFLQALVDLGSVFRWYMPSRFE